jgi:hypothetical protein
MALKNNYEGELNSLLDGYYYECHGPQTTQTMAVADLEDPQQHRRGDGGGGRGHQRLVDSGTPSDDAVRVVDAVTLYDDTRLLDANASEENATLQEVSADTNRTFYAPDAAPDGPLYNVIRVEVVLWKP